MNRSIPSGSALSFINLQPLNPLISRCEIKVLYTGINRNRSFITKEVATKMANSLPGTPIVGEFFYETGDFGDHGQEELVIDKDGVRFVKETVPYGFVPTDAKVWWKNFIDKDGVEREYMVTEGYLWTGRYPETKRIVEEGNHQSMELHRDTLVGEWSKISGEWSKIENDDTEYFIVSDATFTALCVLGQDVEPCFEGANVTANSNLVYSLDKEDFKDRMLDFITDFKFAMSNFNYEGGTKMENLENPIVDENVIPTEHANTEDEFAKKKKEDEEDKKDDSKEEDKSDDNKEEDKSDDSEDEDKKKKKKGFFTEDEEFAKKDEDEEKKSDDEKKEEEEDKKKKYSYSLEEVVEYQELLEKFNALESNYALVTSELEGIKPEFNRLKDLQIEADNNAKEDMINSFYMLSDEDKAPVRENKANFSLEEIESKLSVICVRNKVNFSLDDSTETESNTETPITTFNMGNVQDSTPAWLRAVEQIANRK